MVNEGQSKLSGGGRQKIYHKWLMIGVCDDDDIMDGSFGS